MNTYDIENIKKIIKSRKPIKYSDKGEESIDKFKTMSTDELETIVKDFKNNSVKKASEEFKEIVKYLFDTYAKEKDNIIILSECFGDYDGGRELYSIDDEFGTYTDFSIIDFSKYNKWAKTLNFVEGEEDEDWDYECREVISDVDEKYDILWKLMPELKIPTASYIYSEDAGVNCEWHGYVAVTNDYKIITFICKHDMMEDKYEETAPEPLMIL